MKLSVPANYDLQLVPQLARYPVDEVYGKLPSDFVGGGRPSYMAGRLDRAKLADYVACLGRGGIEFNYLLNSSCLANREWSRQWQKKLNRLLADLKDIGISRLTVSSPYLLERIRAAFPAFRIRVGIFAQVDTPARASFWQALGADIITLESFSINRDFDRLRSIRAAVTCGLQLIANHPCLPNCPMQYYHQNAFAHASNGDRSLFIDYCFLKCTAMRLRDPSLLIRSAWIRPEDIAAYEDLGFDQFKLLERDIPSEDLLLRIDAYSRRKSPEDLSELLIPYGFKKSQPKPLWWLLKYFFKPFSLNPAKLRLLQRMASKAGMLCPAGEKVVRVLSCELPPDFIDRLRTCPGPDCGDCSYCDRIAARAVVFNEPLRHQLLDSLEQFDKQLVTGGLWNV
ncbi:MAG: hypothetical protein LLF76_10325 [Planctomycetaceae bacterium]|nr:hypothetical protein [Planctomycetaceae bacterium]